MREILCITLLANVILLHAQLKDSIIRVAGFQMMVTKDINQNKEKILLKIKEASKEKADFLVTPEASLSGYCNDFDQKILDAALAEVTAAAKAAKVGLFLATCCFETINGKNECFNQVRVYTPEGEYLGFHSKYLRCSPPDKPDIWEMAEYGVTPLRIFKWKDITIGALICNDLWATPGYTGIPNPYLPWKLKEMGAQVIFHSINSRTEQLPRKFHEGSQEVWAHALQIPIISVNASYGADPINASSGMINAEGKRVVVVPDTGEQFFICEVKIK